MHGLHKKLQSIKMKLLPINIHILCIMIYTYKLPVSLVTHMKRQRNNLFIKQAVRYLDIMNELLHFFSYSGTYLRIFI